jgi:hypothetical protein
MNIFCLIETKFIGHQSSMEYGDAVFRIRPQHYEKTIKKYERLQENRSAKVSH